MSQRCSRILERQRGLLGDADAFIDADMELHTQIAAISGNPIYVAVSEAMLGWLKEYHTEMLIWTGKEKYTLAEHEKIIGRIAAHDPKAPSARWSSIWSARARSTCAAESHAS